MMCDSFDEKCNIRPSGPLPNALQGAFCTRVQQPPGLRHAVQPAPYHPAPYHPAPHPDPTTSITLELNSHAHFSVISGQPRGSLTQQQNSVQVTTALHQQLQQHARSRCTARSAVRLVSETSCCRCLRSHCLLDWALAVLDAGDGCRKKAGTAGAGTSTVKTHIERSPAASSDPKQDVCHSGGTIGVYSMQQLCSKHTNATSRVLRITRSNARDMTDREQHTQHADIAFALPDAAHLAV